MSKLPVCSYASVVSSTQDPMQSVKRNKRCLTARVAKAVGVPHKPAWEKRRNILYLNSSLGDSLRWCCFCLHSKKPKPSSVCTDLSLDAVGSRGHRQPSPKRCTKNKW
ncbi:unnamed protein product, partial [Ectocarpus sp. 8 AP-2014]